MAGQNNLINSKYYSGQGAVLVSDRNSAGKPTGFTHFGNVSSLLISMEVTELEHKESTTGARATDLTIITENKVNVTITAENITGETLKFALFGSSEDKLAASVTDLLERAGLGKTSKTDHINLSAVSVDNVSNGDIEIVATVTVNDTVTIDGDVYTAKAVQDIALKQFDQSGNTNATAASLIAVIQGQPASPVLTYEARAHATDADFVQLYAVIPGVGGDSLTLVESTATARLNVSGATFSGFAAGVEGTDFEVNDLGGSIFIIPTSTVFPDDTNVHIDYTYGDHTRVDAFNVGKVNKWLRFEGLNTANSNKAMVVDIFNFSPKPLNEQALINDELAEIVIEGTAQADLNRPAGETQFFREMMDLS